MNQGILIIELIEILKLVYMHLKSDVVAFIFLCNSLLCVPQMPIEPIWYGIYFSLNQTNNWKLQQVAIRARTDGLMVFENTILR